MRWKATLLASIIALLTAPSGAASAVSANALPTYRLVNEYDVGLARIGTVAVEGNSLYATSARRRDVCGARFARFDLATGKRLWRYQLTSSGWGPYAHRKTVLIQDQGCSESSPGTIDGVSASDGQRIYETDGITGVAVGGMAFLTNNHGEDYSTISVWGYSIPKGHVRWEYGPFPRDRQFDVIAAGAGTVEVADYQARTVAALDAKDGHELWTVQAAGIIEPVGAQADGLVFVTICACGPVSGTPNVVALDEATGAVVWGAPGSLQAVHEGLVFANDDGALTAHRASDGSLLWSDPDTVTYSSDPQVGGGIVWVRVLNSRGVPSVRGYAESTGAFLGREPWSEVVGFLGDTVLASADDGRVLAYAPE
jgi:outer membrane protein assembly factor BamB